MSVGVISVMQKKVRQSRAVSDLSLLTILASSGSIIFRFLTVLPLGPYSLARWSQTFRFRGSC